MVPPSNNYVHGGKVQKRWSYASWTAPSHYNLLMGLMPHSNPRNMFASDYFAREAGCRPRAANCA